MPLQSLTPEQRANALKKAAEARQKRAKLRLELKDGKKNLKDVLAKAEDPIIARMKVSTLLQSLPGIGKARAVKIMEDLKISETRRVQGLGSNQRGKLLDAVAGK